MKIRLQIPLTYCNILFTLGQRYIMMLSYCNGVNMTSRQTIGKRDSHHAAVVVGGSDLSLLERDRKSWTPWAHHVTWVVVNIQCIIAKQNFATYRWYLNFFLKFLIDYSLQLKCRNLVTIWLYQINKYKCPSLSLIQNSPV